MVNESTTNKNYPLPHPSNIASQDVGRIANALTMIDADIQSCTTAANSVVSTIQNLNTQALRIPSSLVGSVDPELKNLQPKQYVVVNEDASGFSTVEGGGGEGGLKGEILVKKSDANFDTTWADPRSISKKSPVINETNSDFALKNNCVVILADSLEIDNSDQTPRRGLTHRQVISDTICDETFSYILCDAIDSSAEDKSDIASATNFGRVKIGSGINLNNGTISVDTIGIANKNDFGLVKIGDGLNVENGVISTQTYPHADHENFGIIKPSSDFSFGSNGELQLVKQTKDVMYQIIAKNFVEHGVIKLVTDCAYYRAFVQSDTMFNFDLSDFNPNNDVAFDLEIISDGEYVIRFDKEILWTISCAGVEAGSTLIHFEKFIGENCFRATLKSTTGVGTERLLTLDSSSDVTDNYICAHTGLTGISDACKLLATHNVQYDYTSPTNPNGVTWSIDFAKSTYVTYIQLYLYSPNYYSYDFFFVEASVDKKNWITLDSRSGKIESTTLTLNVHSFFKYYRLRWKGGRLSYVQFYGYDVEDAKFELSKVVPIMAADSSNGFVITSSGVTDGNLYNITTDTTGDYANFETQLNDEFWIKYELPEAESVDMIDLGARQGTECNRMPTWFKIEASNDDTNWDLILERQYLSQWYHGETRQFWVNNSTKYKYYRLSSIEQPTAYFSLSRFRLFKKIEGQIPTVGFVPQMSSISQGGYVASCSSVSASSRSPHHAFDNDIGTAWVSAENNITNEWIQIKFPMATICDAIWMRSRNDEYYIQAPTSFEILGSNDGENFITIKTFSNLSWTQAEQKILEFQNANEYLYYRVHSLSVCDGGTRFALSELNFGSLQRQYKRELHILRKLTPTMNSNSQDGFVVTANSIYSGSKVYNPFEAFNNSVSDSSSWTTKTQSGWIQVELPEADKANMFRMSGGFSSEEPDSFILYGSNDGENYDELLNSGALTWTHNETKTWDLENDTAYKFYKVEAVNTKSAYITISEIQLLEKSETREY